MIGLQWSDMQKMGDSPISCCLPLPFRKMSHMNYFLRSFKWDTFKVHSTEVATVKNIENSVCNAGVKKPVTKTGHRNVCCQSLNAVIWNNPGQTPVSSSLLSSPLAISMIIKILLFDRTVDWFIVSSCSNGCYQPTTGCRQSNLKKNAQLLPCGTSSKLKH